MLRLAALVLGLTLAAQAEPYSDLYFFGDSLSDTGNIYDATTFLNSLTFGIVPIVPSSPPYFDGRFSNGPLWAEQVAQRLGQGSDANSAGMYLSFLGNIGGTGNNYAIGGARAGLDGELPSFLPTGLQAQTEFYLARHNNTADPNALYFIFGGGNDLRDIASADPSTWNAAAVAAAEKISLSMQRLYVAGARNFLLVNAPNIGFTPEALSGGSSAAGAQVSLVFNHALSLYAQAYSTLPGMNLMNFDLFSLYLDLVSDTLNGGSVYGFTSLVPCMNPGPGVPSCDTSLFFDMLHPTARVHALFGNLVADEIFGSSVAAASSLQFDAIETQTPEPSTAIAGGAIVVILGVRFLRRRSRFLE